jgi:hypothetical protein
MIDLIERPAWTESIDARPPIPASGVFGMTRDQIMPAKRCDMTRDEFERLMAGGPRNQWSRLSASKAA